MSNETNVVTTEGTRLQPGEPYCGACGYVLKGAVDAARCPECGRPIVEVLTRAGRLGRRYRSATTMFGLPLIDVALGSTHTEAKGSARGVFAVGDDARGLVAVGGTALGVVAVGGRAIGVFSLGGISVGLVSACGGISVGSLAAGGVAMGLLTYGGVSAGVVADGGVTLGVYAVGALRMGVGSMANEVVRDFWWFFGRTTPLNVWRVIFQPWLVVLGLPMVATVAIGMLTAARHAWDGRRSAGR